MKVKIYRSAKSAMQSGKKNTKKWHVEPIDLVNHLSCNKLMGWVSTDSTQSQLKFEFANKEAAIDFAKSQNFEYEVVEPNLSSVKKKSYAANFTN